MCHTMPGVAAWKEIVLWPKAEWGAAAVEGSSFSV